jgi:hypothetical protein
MPPNPRPVPFRHPTDFPTLYTALCQARAVTARIPDAPPDDAPLLWGVVLSLLEEAEATAEACETQMVRGGCP